MAATIVKIRDKISWLDINYYFAVKYKFNSMPLSNVLKSFKTADTVV